MKEKLETIHTKTSIPISTQVLMVRKHKPNVVSRVRISVRVRAAVVCAGGLYVWPIFVYVCTPPYLIYIFYSK